MTVKQTDRVQIQTFGTNGIQIFNQIEILLGQLVEETATVHYRGANALEFKTKCTTNAVDFAGYCTTNMQLMSQVITEATTFIATALGGATITLEPPTVTVGMPSIDADTSVEAAEDGPLMNLRESTTSIYNQIETLFAQNLTNMQTLGGDGWIGPEYDSALGDITNLTGLVTDATTNSRDVLTKDITNQLQALGFSG